MILSQYANSPIISSLEDSFESAISTDENFENFYNWVLDLNTAQGFGLDIWGSILRVSRNTPLNTAETYTMTDDLYRTILKLKAGANISNCSIASLNLILNTIFKDRGTCYVIETETMVLRYNFYFNLTSIEQSIFQTEGLPPKPAGVAIETYVIDPTTVFGFNGSELQPFNQGTFWR